MPKMIITNKGKELMTQIMTDTNTMRLVRVETSSHDYYDYSDIAALEALEDIKQSSSALDMHSDSQDQVTVKTVIKNSESSEGYYLRSTGIIVENQDKEEILYAIGVWDVPPYISPLTEQSSTDVILEFVLCVGNAEDVNIEINPAGTATMRDIYVLREEKMDKNLKGAANGIAELDVAGHVPSSQLSLDGYLDENSNNPVQNQVIYNRFKEIEGRVKEGYQIKWYHPDYNLDEAYIFTGGVEGVTNPRLHWPYLDYKTGYIYEGETATKGTRLDKVAEATLIQEKISAINDGLSQKIDGRQIIIAPNSTYVFEDFYPLGRLIFISSRYKNGYAIYHYYSTGNPPSCYCILGELPSQIDVGTSSSNDYHLKVVNNSSDYEVYITVI